MKKVFLLVFYFIYLSSLIFSETKILSHEKLEKVIEPKLCYEKTSFQNVSKDSLLEDFDAFTYFFSTSYIAFDDMVKNGLDLKDFALGIRSEIERNIIKDSDELIKNIYERLQSYISDSHFSIANNNCFYNFNSRLQKQNKNSDTSRQFLMRISNNSIYLKMPEFLPDFFMKQTASKEYFEKVYSEFENIKKKKYLIIDLRNCSGGITDYPLLLLYSLYEGKKNIIPSNIYDARLLLSETMYSTSKSIQTPVTEDLRLQRAIKFNNIKDEEVFRSSSIIQKEQPARIIEAYNQVYAKKLHNSAYKGKILFLTSDKTASAAECLILFSKLLFKKNIKVIGQNTLGCFTYIDVFQLCMPNNSFGMSMSFCSIEASLKNFACWKGEGIGIEPDIKCSDSEILQNVRKITKDKRLRNFL